jgi:hypothetical protein
VGFEDGCTDTCEDRRAMHRSAPSYSFSRSQPAAYRSPHSPPVPIQFADLLESLSPSASQHLHNIALSLFTFTFTSPASSTANFLFPPLLFLPHSSIRADEGLHRLISLPPLSLTILLSGGGWLPIYLKLRWAPLKLSCYIPLSEL